MKDNLTQNEYLQVVALLKVARDKSKEAEQYAESLGKVIDDVDMAFDYVFGYPEIEAKQMLEQLDIEVKEYEMS